MYEELECKSCGYKWIPRLDRPPKVCPFCKSRNWNKEVKDVEHKRKTVVRK